MRAFALFLTTLSLTSVSAREIQQQPEGSTRFVGSFGCRSSSCHGGAGPKRSQYLTWSQQDFHTRAFAILLDARSARIAESVGIADPSANVRCTVCHLPFQSVAPGRLGPNVRSDEGVSCETCHGAAEAWLRGHTRPDWTYPMRVSAGMRDLRNLYVRANACVACHQNVDREILQAGHPAMVFELDSQSINEPKHWSEQDQWSGARAWLTGQAVALREAAFRARTDSDPSNDAQETSLALAWLLAKVTVSDPALPKLFEPSSSDLEPVQTQADELALRAAAWNVNTDSAMSILRALADTESELVAAKTGAKEASFYRAERLSLACERLAIALGIERKMQAELKALHQDVQRQYDFDLAAFGGHLRAFRMELPK